MSTYIFFCLQVYNWIVMVKDMKIYRQYAMNMTQGTNVYNNGLQSSIEQNDVTVYTMYPLLKSYLYCK